MEGFCVALEVLWLAALGLLVGVGVFVRLMGSAPTRRIPVYCPSCGQLSGFRQIAFVGPKPGRLWHPCRRCEEMTDGTA